MRALVFWLALGCWAAPNPRVGFYQWAGGPQTAAEDFLTLSRERIKSAGAGLMRFYLGARFDYLHPVLSPQRFPDLQDRVPARILQLDRYREAITDPALPTLILTAYPSMDYGAGPDDINLFRPWGAREEQQEYRQMFDLSTLLLGDYGQLSKTVILSNTEADSQLLEILNHTGSSELAIQNIIAWQNTRYRAVEDARKHFPHTRLKLLSAFEISLVRLKFYRDGAHFIKHPRGAWNALTRVVPKVRFDVLSYSCYESINSPYETGNIDTPAEQAGARLERDLKLLKETVSAPIMVGELGLPYDRFDGLRSGGVVARLSAALRALETSRPAYVVFWQVFDAPPHGPEPVQFGWLDPRRSTPAVLLRFIASYH